MSMAFLGTYFGMVVEQKYTLDTSKYLYFHKTYP